jgi:hypothetical protein
MIFATITEFLRVQLWAYLQFFLLVARWACLVCAPVFVCVGIAIGITHFRLSRNGLSVTGTVLRLQVHHDPDSGSDTYNPVFSFQTKTGEYMTVTSSYGSRPAAFAVGETVLVAYDSHAPSNAEIRTFPQMWGTPLLFGGVGVGFGCVALASFWYERRQNRLTIGFIPH